MENIVCSKLAVMKAKLLLLFSTYLVLKFRFKNDISVPNKKRGLVTTFVTYFLNSVYTVPPLDKGLAQIIPSIFFPSRLEPALAVVWLRAVLPQALLTLLSSDCAGYPPNPILAW